MFKPGMWVVIKDTCVQAALKHGSIHRLTERKVIIGEPFWMLATPSTDAFVGFCSVWEKDIEPYQFKVGDKVRIVRKVETEPGWANVWYVAGMDPYVNTPSVRIIKDTSDMGIQLVGTPYRWHKESLDLVETAAADVFNPVPADPQPVPKKPAMRIINAK